jgi:hypothetical protein
MEAASVWEFCFDIWSGFDGEFCKVQLGRYPGVWKVASIIAVGSPCNLSVLNRAHPTTPQPAPRACNVFSDMSTSLQAADQLYLLNNVTLLKFTLQILIRR